MVSVDSKTDDIVRFIRIAVEKEDACLNICNMDDLKINEEFHWSLDQFCNSIKHLKYVGNTDDFTRVFCGKLKDDRLVCVSYNYDRIQGIDINADISKDAKVLFDEHNLLKLLVTD
jgi:hypothetical protein